MMTSCVGAFRSSRSRCSRPRDMFFRLRHWLLLLTVAVVTASPAHSVTRIFDVPSTMLVAEVTITLRPMHVPTHGRHSIELRNFGPQSDALLYVMNTSHSQVGSGFAVNGVVGVGLNGFLSGQFLVIVRSRTATAIQNGDLWVDGRLVAPGLKFTSGALLRIPNFTIGEELDAVGPPVGAPDHVVYLLSANGSTILRRASGVFTAVSLPGFPQNVTAVYATKVPQHAGTLRVYLNDVAHDSDGDGLGDDLETQLGTCATNSGSVAGVNCNEIADSRDTDGDGLQDGWEVLGKRFFGQNGPGYLALPTWGANPRHKDIFIEVDYRRLNLDENQQGITQHMPTAVARQMAAIYGDDATTDPIIRIVHSLSVQNPDRLTGISVHLDTGVSPERPEDATIYGDWGGFNAVDATADGPANPGDVWKEQLGPGRMGIFHYVLGYTTGGGSCGQGIVCGFNMDYAPNAAHEFGHTLGLNHNGPYTVADEPNCKPNYPSLMNYAYYESGYAQFSDGRNLSNLNNHLLQETNAIDPSNVTLLNYLSWYFDYKVDYVAGNVDWNRDGQFSPASTPVRAYANYKPGNDCEFTREGEQDSGLLSTHSPAVVRYKNLIWIFTIDQNGKLTYDYTTQPWNCSPDADLCPAIIFQTPGTRDLGPVAAIDAKTFRVNGIESIVVVGIRPDGSMLYTWLTADDNYNQVWGSILNIDGSSPAAGEPSLANSHDEGSLVLAYKGTDNVVHLRSFTGHSWTPEQQVVVAGAPVAVHPDTSPAVVFTYLPIGIVAGQEHLIGAFADPQGWIQFYAPQFPGHQWGYLPIPNDGLYSTVGRPSMAWAPGPGDGGVLELGSSGTSSNTARNMRSAAVSGTHGGPIRSLPGVGVSQPLTLGRLYILFFGYSTPPSGYPATNAVRMAMSYVSPYDGKLRIGLNSYFDNVWSYAYGISLITPSDIALHAAETYSIHKPESENHVFFRPHADGMADLTYKNYDDWKTLGWGSCAIVAHWQTDSPVKCADAW